MSCSLIAGMNMMDLNASGLEALTAIPALQLLLFRNEHGGPIHDVTSAYRCPRWNIHEGGTTNSRHTQGDAFDFDDGDAPENWAVAWSAKDVGIYTVKILLYPQNGGGSYQPLQWFIDHGYNGTNLPLGWTMYRFGHITTSE